MSARRGQLVLLAAAVVVTALAPMLLAYAQLAADADPRSATERAALADAKRSLERSVADTTLAVANGTDADDHRSVRQSATDRLGPALDALESSEATRALVVDVARNDTAARRWAGRACPFGPERVFEACVTTDGVVTQTRANSTALVAVAFDIVVRGPDGTARATVVIRGVGGAVADRPTADPSSLRRPDTEPGRRR
jgi:hypothetical protein